MKVQLIVEFDIEMNNGSFDAHAKLANEYMGDMIKSYSEKRLKAIKEHEDRTDICKFQGAHIVCHDIMTLKVFDEAKVWA